jgi:hypothetical protein
MRKTFRFDYRRMTGRCDRRFRLPRRALASSHTRERDAARRVMTR